PLTVCEPGPTAWSRALTLPYQLIVLALRVESAADGELVRELPAVPRSPVIVLADFGSPRVEAELLDAGSDAVVREGEGTGLFAGQVQPVLRRIHGRTEPTTAARISVQDIEIDMDRRRAIRAGQPMRLTRVEFALL